MPTDGQRLCALWRIPNKSGYRTNSVESYDPSFRTMRQIAICAVNITEGRRLDDDEAQWGHKDDPY
jgi:hypothetical protein